MTPTPDLIVRPIIDAGLTLIQGRPGLIDQIFAGLDSPARAVIKTYVASWDEPTVRPEVRLGWALATARMPAIAITLPGEQEAGQFVGSEPGRDYDDDTDETSPSWAVENEAYLEGQVAQMQGAVDCAIYSINAQETSWLATITRWLLLRHRATLEEAGLIEQRLQMTDFMPASDYPQPDPAYTRVVKLSYTAFVHYILEDDDPGALLTATSARAINTSDV